MSAIKQERRIKKRYKRIAKVIRKHLENRSHAQRLRASKRVYDSALFDVSSMVELESIYNDYMIHMSHYPLLVEDKYKLLAGTGAITYEPTINI